MVRRVLGVVEEVRCTPSTRARSPISAARMTLAVDNQTLALASVTIAIVKHADVPRRQPRADGHPAHGLAPDAVSDPADRVNERLTAGPIDLLTQQLDERVERVVFDVPARSPHALDQRLARHHAAGTPHQILEQAELGTCERHVTPPRDTVCVEASSVRSATCSGTAWIDGPRLANAWMRASSTSNENGFVR